MRQSRTLLIIATSLAWPIAAAAQAAAPVTPAQAAPAATQAAVAPALLGFIDFGVRNTSTDGDAARYERYRDLGDGLFIETFRWQREARGFFTNLAADHVGPEDQRYTRRRRPARPVEELVSIRPDSDADEPDDADAVQRRHRRPESDD